MDKPGFQEIDVEDMELMEELDKSLLKRLPESVHMIVLLRLARQQRFPPEVDIKFYRYSNGASSQNEDYPGSEDFIVCIQKPNFHTSKGVILLTPQTPTPEMLLAFDSLLSWDSPQLFQCVQQPFWEPIWDLCRSHGKLVPSTSQGFSLNLFGILDMEKALSLEVPQVKDLKLRQLCQDDLPRVVERWPRSQSPESREVMGPCLRSGLLGCATFDTSKSSGSASGKMASCVLQSPLGLYSMLGTPDEFRGRGLAQLVMRWVSREGARRMDLFPLAEVEAFNEANKAILRKTGYDELYQTKWFFYEPK